MSEFIEIYAPDGTIVEFPQGTADETIERAMAEEYPMQQPPAQEMQEDGPTEAHLGHKIGAAFDGAAQTLTFDKSDEIAAGLNSGFGYLSSYDDALKTEQARMAENQRLAGNYELGGRVAANIATIAKAGATKLGANIMGVTGKNLATRTGKAIVSGGAISGGDTALRQGLDGRFNADDVITSTGLGMVGGSIPALGAGIRGGYRYGKGIFNTLSKPRTSALDSVARGLTTDIAEGAVLSADDIANAAARGHPVNIGEMGGENVRALARSAANNSQSARNAMSGISDKFGQQYHRATDFVSSLVKGNVDDLALQEDLLEAATKVNKPAYEKAYNFGFGKSGGIEFDTFLAKIPAAAVGGAKRAAKASGDEFGEQLIAHLDEVGDVVKFKRMPSFRQWDYIQRGLRAAKNKAYKAGDVEYTSYKELHKKLLATMDNANPSFKEARGGAAQAFGVDDAIEAGRKAATTSMKNPQMQRVILKMKKPELEAFRVGYAGKLIQKMKRAGNRTDVINSTFNSPESKEKMAMIFGAKKLKELESFLRVENAMKLFKNEVQGGSTTARQFAEMALGVGGKMGVGGGMGYALGENPQSAAMGALLAAGNMKGNSLIQTRIGKEIAKIIMSGDPKMIEQLTRKAVTNKTVLPAIKQIESILVKLSIAGGVSAGVANLRN